VDVSVALGTDRVHAFLTVADMPIAISDDRASRCSCPTPIPIFAHAFCASQGEVFLCRDPSRWVVADFAAILRRRLLLPFVTTSLCRHHRLPMRLNTGRAACSSRVASDNEPNFIIGYGDVASAFAVSPHIFREYRCITGAAVNAMECRGVVADFDPRPVDFVWSSTQTPASGKARARGFG